MKIALIGNMNNNNFSLMRYFRDLGADAHLLLYRDDGTGTLSHFRPESDTWEMEKWAPYIHRTKIPNSTTAVWDFPLSWLLAGRVMVRAWLGFQNTWLPPVTRRQVRQAYAGYDRLIASGITPATLRRLNRRLDIFYPYASGVEFLRSPVFTEHYIGRGRVSNWLGRRIASLQAQGIQSSRHALTFGCGHSGEVLKSINVTSLPLAVPMVYNNESLPDTAPSQPLRIAAERIAGSQFSVLHQARLMWKKSCGRAKGPWPGESKNNHWVIRMFAKLIIMRPNLKPLLLMVEYGPDVEPSKQLARELGIEQYIHWLPKMPRRELMWLLSRVSIGCGQFYERPRMVWGGTGWESLASGKPLLQGFNFAPGEFDRIYGYPPPPMLPVREEQDILRHLLKMADNPGKRVEIGRSAKEWFNRYNGIELATKWLDLLGIPRDGEDDHEVSGEPFGVNAL